MKSTAALATFIAGSALACVLAYWGWQLFGPVAVHIPPAGAANPAAALIAANLFGGATAPSVSAVIPGDAVLGRFEASSCGVVTITNAVSGK